MSFIPNSQAKTISHVNLIIIVMAEVNESMTKRSLADIRYS